MTTTVDPPVPSWINSGTTAPIVRAINAHQAKAFTRIVDGVPELAIDAAAIAHDALMGIAQDGLIVVADPRVELLLFEDTAHEHRWTARDRGNHEIVAVSGDGYRDNRHRNEMAARLFPVAYEAALAEYRQRVMGTPYHDGQPI
jgi:hypothetical protein